MNDAAEFISKFTPKLSGKIDFAWNGKHAADFVDTNQIFRWQVVELCIENSQLASPILLERLFLADANWSVEAWGSPYHFAQLGKILLERGEEKAIESFSKGFICSFDTFGACHEIRLSEQLLGRLKQHVKLALDKNIDELQRKELESAAELFEKIGAGVADQGWARVEPGTPVSNIRVIWPRWFHKIWIKAKAIFSKQPG